MMVEVELKRCPYCGSVGIIESGDCSNGIGGLIYKFYDVICTNPNCIAHPDCPKTFESRKKAIEAWNRRVEDD